MTARRTSRWCCRERFPTCWPTARRASRSAWRRRSRRTMSPNSATRRFISSTTPNARSRTLLKYVPGPDFPTGGVIVDPPEADRRGLYHRSRFIPGAGTLAQGRHRPRHLSHRRHRDSLAGAEGPAGRAAGRAHQRQEAAACCRCPRRIRRGHPARDRAALAHGRCRAADGVAVQAHRARKPHPAQHECAVEGPHPQGCRSRRGAHRMAHPSPRGAAAAVEFPPQPDRASARSAGRLSRRLSQPRQGHQDHPQRG